MKYRIFAQYPDRAFGAGLVLVLGDRMIFGPPFFLAIDKAPSHEL